MSDAQRSGYARFLVQFVDHVTYELEVDAASEHVALECASQLLRASGKSGFTVVEHDVTDWLACLIQDSELPAPRGRVLLPDSPGLVPVSAHLRHTPVVIQSSELFAIMELLCELRDTTLRKSTFQSATSLIGVLENALDGVPHA